MIIIAVAVVAVVFGLAAGWHFGVKTALLTTKSIARNHLNDAEYAEFVRLLDKVTQTP